MSQIRSSGNISAASSELSSIRASVTSRVHRSLLTQTETKTRVPPLLSEEIRTLSCASLFALFASSPGRRPPWAHTSSWGWSPLLVHRQHGVRVRCSGSRAECQMPHCAFRATLVPLPTSPCTRGITCASPAQRDASKGSRKKKLATCWCQDAAAMGCRGWLSPHLSLLCANHTQHHCPHGCWGAAGMCPAALPPLALLKPQWLSLILPPVPAGGSAGSSGVLLPPRRHNNAQRTGWLCPLPGPPFPLASPVSSVRRRPAARHRAGPCFVGIT